MDGLVEPHGGVLVDRFIPEAEVAKWAERAKSLFSVALDPREQADLELIATGAASPLTGFLGLADYKSVLERMRLFDGTVWTLPLTLAVDNEAKRSIAPGQSISLTDERGRVWAVLEVSELFQRDPLAEAKAIYRTESSEHPGVAYLQSRPTWLVAGKVHAFPLPNDLPFAEHRLSPKVLRARIKEKGWKKVAGFQTRNPIHRAHEYLTKLALEQTDGLVLHPLMGQTKGDDVPAQVRFEVYQALLANYYPKDRTLFSVFPAAMRYAGPREAIFHALVRKNYGINHLIVGRDHAGVGKFYGPFEAQEMFDRFSPDELKVAPLKFDATFYCKTCLNLASARTCPHDPSHRLELSGTKVREILRAGGTLPAEFTRPEIAEILRRHYTNAGEQLSAAARTADPPTEIAASKGGFVLWFTGLSGAGKSTLANHLRTLLAKQRSVEILDGDEVRTYLSKGLGFSKEDRDTNIRRIGYVARVLARNGVATITAAISPYADTREEVKALAAKDGIPFIEVYAQAELNVLADRDVKGLYKKAMAGEIAHFTGVTDPYEPPQKPDVVVRSDQETIEQSASKILAVLTQKGLL